MAPRTEERTHEEYLQRTRDAVIACADLTAEETARLRHTKLVYGVGNGSYRGVCVYEAWENGVGKVDVIEVAATAEESWVQLAGTTAHELAHVLAGHAAGHGPEWKRMCAKLGLRLAMGNGQAYRLAQFSPRLRECVYTLAKDIDDGSPAFRTSGMVLTVTPRPCSAGIGTRGGKSRGKGSGSRLRLWECECNPVVKVRVASDDFQATCGRCGREFHRVQTSADERRAA